MGRRYASTSSATMSIFPYHYGNSDENSTLTVNSENAAVTFREYTSSANGQDRDGRDEATVNLIIRLDANGYSEEGEVDNEAITAQQTIFEFNFIEFMLRQYLDLLRSILTSNDMRNVPRFPSGDPLVSNSFVNSYRYPTSNPKVQRNSVLGSGESRHTGFWQAETMASSASALCPIRTRKLNRSRSTTTPSKACSSTR